MSKERLEEIIERTGKIANYGGEVDLGDVAWLIHQVELAQHFAKKNAELNEFLQNYNEPKHLGRNVIDVAMDIITEQAERVQELESQIKKEKKAHKKTRDKFNRHKHSTSENWRAQRATKNRNTQLENVLEKFREENKRLREALEFYADDGKWDQVNHGSPYMPDYRRDIEDDMGEVAQKALEDESE